MNTSALKSFAPAVRRQLMEAVTRKLDYVLTADTPDLRAASEQVKSLREEAMRDRTGLIERVAYTWFNRLAAIRFLDARGWHPFHARVLTSATGEETQPELLKLVRAGSLPEELRPHADPERIDALLDGSLPTSIAGADPQGEVYRHLVLAACRCYHALLPNLFEAINDETELLLPDDLLTATSVAETFRTEITDEDCAEVEILGWLYQFYISEKKDAVMARKSAVPTEDIPAVTQLFTPHWIVRYLVENSLGRLWLLNRPGSRLREHMPYYIEGEPETNFLKITKPEEIRLCDPAVGSGHMLTYAFDLLTLIYEEEGYAPTEVPALILRHNLHGLEICPRAAQLAELALVFKARQSSRCFFQPEHLVRPHIIELRDVRFAENELRDYIHALGLGDLFQQPVLRLLHQFEEAKNFGSLIQPCLDEPAIADLRRAIEAKDLGGQLFLRETHLKVLRVLEQAEALTQRYHCVVANPPYMGTKTMNAGLASFGERHYPDSFTDVFAMFISRGVTLVKADGYLAMITMQGWMFQSSFESFRVSVLSNLTLISLIHLGARAFDTIGGAVVQTAAFSLQCRRNPSFKGLFVRATEGTNEKEKEQTIRSGENRHSISGEELSKLPGRIVAYWASKSIRSCFLRLPALGSVLELKAGLSTGNNAIFQRQWFEVAVSRIRFGASAYDSALRTTKWFPCHSGGAYRKWYGNHEVIIDWSDNGREMREYGLSEGKIRSAIRNESYYFREGITYSKISSGSFAARHRSCGFIFDDAGRCAFSINTSIKTIQGLLCSIVAHEFLKILTPTINFTSKELEAIPFAGPSGVDSAVEELVSIARADWDNFETSWDFRDQPLLRPGLEGATLEASWRNWEAQSTAAIRRMQELETENNRLFIAAYGLDGELQPEVPDEQITLARAEARRDMAAFLSYAVGCMMGRYSPDHPGLILANAGDSLREFLEKVGKPLVDLTFAPDEDGIIPVLDGEWFEDDIVARTRDFLRATFGETTLRENLRFLEESLGKSLEKYFLTDFYKDHLQTYKKRPIYWRVTSPKGSFQALIYLHRYTKDTVNTLLNSYLREFLHKLEARINQLIHTEATTTSAREKTAALKEAEKLRKSLKECQAWEREVVLPLAQQRIELDLDDGVKANYLKFPDLLAKIPGLEKKEE